MTMPSDYSGWDKVEYTYPWTIQEDEDFCNGIGDISDMAGPNPSEMWHYDGPAPILNSGITGGVIIKGFLFGLVLVIPIVVFFGWAYMQIHP